MVSRRTSRGTAVVLGCALGGAACSGNPVGPPPHPTPPILGPIVPPPWSFDGGTLPDGFTVTGNLGTPVACSKKRSDEPGFERGQIDKVGGDYWKTDVAQGAAGLCWMRTGDTPTGTIESSAFLPSPRWLSFSIKRPLTSLTKVKLVEGTRVVAETAPSQGGPRFVHVVWDLGALFPDKAPARPVKLVVEDDDPAASIEASDAVLSEQAPAPSDAVDPRDHIWGFADLHAHLLSPMAFGGQLFWGNIHSAITPQGATGPKGPSDPTVALGVCNPMHGTPPGGGDGVLFDMPPEMGHSRFGFPGFVGFSNFQTVYHQQAYLDWLRRAWQGGLRLLEADAVNYQFLQVLYQDILLYTPGSPANSSGDEWNIREQTKAARAFAELPDVASFAGVALTPDGARTLARDGKLALVLGTETETFGGLDKKLTGMTNEPDIRALVQPYLGCLRERGVRHVIAVHLGENAFGSPSLSNVEFDLGNSAMRGNHFTLRATTPEERIWYSQDADWKDQSDMIKLIADLGISGISPPPPGPKGPAGQANALGLTVPGRIVIEEMMRTGMIVDIEHMSALAEDQVLTIAEKYGYPVIASHTGFRDTSLLPNEAAQPESWASERAKSKTQLQRVRALGGLVGVGTSRGPTRVDPKIAACDGSTPSFLANMRYAIDAMGGSNVGFGTDINGLGQQDAPRFGPFACWTAGDDTSRVNLLAGQRDAQSGGVAYDPRTPIKRHDYDRFSGQDRSAVASGKQMYLTQDQRYAWEAAARYIAGDGENANQPNDPDPVKTRKYARGFWLAKNGKLEGADSKDKAVEGAYWGCLRSAVVCLGAASTVPEPKLTSDVAKTAAMIADVWTAWGKMSGKNTPLTRSSIGGSDFDLNIDGLAHYGMLPDLLQDAKNLGLTEQEISVLFQGAEAFVEMWEKAEKVAPSVNKALPPSVCDTDPSKCTCAAVSGVAADPPVDPALYKPAHPRKPPPGPPKAAPRRK